MKGKRISAFFKHK